MVIGAHSPEFPFEHDVENVRPALEAMGVGYPVAIDNDFAVWRAFGNQYWPALYVADAQGRLRDHHSARATTGSERVIQQLLAEAGSTGSTGWSRRPSRPGGPPIGRPCLGETYVGYARAASSRSGRLAPTKHVYGDRRLGLNQWALSGDWTVADRPPC